jgi:hypothetical protein
MIRGSCLCGGARFEIDGPISPIGHCHCSKCRKVTGTASNAVFWVDTARTSLRFTQGEELVRTFRLASGWASVFCAECGSPMPHQNRAGTRYFVPAGSLDDDPGVRPAVHIFVGSKAPWDEIHGPQPQFTEDFGSARVDVRST